MPNPWIEFLKDYAKKNNTTYRNALSNPELKALYQQSKSKPVLQEVPVMETVKKINKSKNSVLNIEPQPLIPNPKPVRGKKLKEIPANNLSYNNIYEDETLSYG